MLKRLLSGLCRDVMTRGGLLALLLSLSGVATPVQAAQVTYYHTDGLGSVVMESNEAAQVTYTREYRPYGDQVVGAPKEGPGFTGHVRDDTGLTYMQQRYYDPGIGRFLSVDPVPAMGDTGANFNRYWYANNNPYKFTDPDGRESACFVNGVGCGLRPYTAADHRKIAVSMAGLAATAVALVSPAAARQLLVWAGSNSGTVATATNIAAEAAGVTGAAGAAGLAAREVKALVAAGNKPFNSSGLSVAARKLEQHANRPGGTFAAPTGSVAQKNQAASETIQEILENSGTTRTNLSGGGFEFRSPIGQGVRFDMGGSFNTFLDPKR